MIRLAVLGFMYDLSYFISIPLGAWLFSFGYVQVFGTSMALYVLSCIIGLARLWNFKEKKSKEYLQQCKCNEGVVALPSGQVNGVYLPRKSNRKIEYLWWPHLESLSTFATSQSKKVEPSSPNHRCHSRRHPPIHCPTFHCRSRLWHLHH